VFHLREARNQTSYYNQELSLDSLIPSK
jgi:hypothetical protein